MSKMSNFEAACEYLCSLITQGMEYPDAQWKAAQKYHVSADDLQEWYDAE